MKWRIVILIGILGLLVLWWKEAPDGKTRIIFCDVGQGDGILISQNNLQMMIDSGPKNRKMVNCLSSHLPFWDKKIEVAIMTHGDQDHVGGLSEVSKSYKIGNLFSNDLLKDMNEQIIYSKKLTSNSMVRMGMIEFDVVSPDENVNFTTDDKNENSIVGVLSYGSSKILFMGDATKEIEEKLVWKIWGGETKSFDILKVSHHGSETATGEGFLNNINVKTAVVSVGKNNRFGHPNKEVVKRLINRGIEIKRTDEEGDVVYIL